MAQRVDAQRNYQRILAIAGLVVEEQGTEASLRDIARRAGIGLGTLYRHFPTRDALLATLLGQRFQRLAERATELGKELSAEDALTTWLREYMDNASVYRGLAASLMATLGQPGSPLYDSCKGMQTAVKSLLRRAQKAGRFRKDVDGPDLFALISAVTWIGEQHPDIAARREQLFTVVMDGLVAR